MTIKTDDPVADIRTQIRLTRQKIALLTAVLGVEAEHTTLAQFSAVLENLYYQPTFLREILSEHYELKSKSSA